MPFQNYKYGKSRGMTRYKKSISGNRPYHAYTLAKKSWKGSALYNKKALQQSFGYSKTRVVDTRRLMGAQTHGYLGSRGRYVTSTLLPSQLPRVGGKSLKIIDAVERGNDQIKTRTGVDGMAPQVMQPIASVTGGINGIKQGNTVSQRQGDKVHLKRLEITGVIGFPALATDTVSETAMGQAQMRIMLVVDKQSNQTTATVDQILDGNDDDALSSRQRNFSNRRRFDILCDKLITIPAQQDVVDGSTAQTIAQTSAVPITMSIELNQSVKYAELSTDGLAGDIVSNNIYLIVGSDHKPPVAVLPTDVISRYFWDFKTRVMFTD